MTSERDTGWTRRAAIAVGGGAGTGVRVLVAAVVPVGAGGFPIATLAVNLAGALLLGIALGLLLPTGRARLTSLICTGALGALTTFSTFAVEVVELVDTAPFVALAYVAISLSTGPVLARAGLRWSRGW
ncbi:MAG: CrcB family protein [Actinobacteria bacterium]|nr:CrcB family protein [Actinomycetota bacterium]